MTCHIIFKNIFKEGLFLKLFLNNNFFLKNYPILFKFVFKERFCCSPFVFFRFDAALGARREMHTVDDDNKKLYTVAYDDDNKKASTSRAIVVN